MTTPLLTPVVLLKSRLTNVTIALLLVSMASVWAAVDCRAPRTRQQRVVCTNADLVELDRQLETAIQKAMAASSESAREQLRIEQSSWESESGGCWDRLDCIRKRYEVRLAAVEAIIVRTPSGAPDVPTQANRTATSARQSDVNPSDPTTVAVLPRSTREQALEASRQRNQERADAMQRSHQAKLDAVHLATEVEALEQQKDGLKDRIAELGAGYSIKSSHKQHLSASELSGGNGAEVRQRAESLRVEIAELKDELTKRQEQGLEYSRTVLQSVGAQTQSGDELSDLIRKAGSSPDGPFKAYQAAKRLEAAVRAFNATKERAEKLIKTVAADMGLAARYSTNQDVAEATKTIVKAVNEVSTKAQSKDPKDDSQLSSAVQRLTALDRSLNFLVRQTEVLGTATGKRVYSGCTAWARRGGLIATDSPVRYFKDAETNRYAELAANLGRSFCACTTTLIAGDKRLTDEAKLEIAHQFETRNQMDNQALSGVVGAAFLQCQIKATDDIAGGAISRAQ